MIAELERQPELGFLGADLWFGRTLLMVQYWRSFELLEAYAKARDHAHLPAWAAFNRGVGSSGDVGVFHETYEVAPDACETIYVNMPAMMFGKVGRPARGQGRLPGGALAPRRGRAYARNHRRLRRIAAASASPFRPISRQNALTPDGGLQLGAGMKLGKYLSAALAGAALVILAGSAQAANNPRIALVIGESAYPDAALPTAANDAGLVAQVLQAAGFDVVGARDLDQKSVRESLRDFLDKANAAGPDMQAFVYFSGRALQYAGDNYLAPIDARIARDSDTPIEAVKISDFTHALAAAPGLARVVVIDGARPNPYAQTGSPLAGGLALVEPEANTFVAFNAAPGAIGVEDAGDYGVYAKTLAGLMRQGGVDVPEIFAETRIEVNQQTAGRADSVERRQAQRALFPVRARRQRAAAASASRRRKSR